MSIGILGILYAGLSFYEIAKNPMQYSLSTAITFYFAKGALIGMSLVLALSLSARNFDREEADSCVGGVRRNPDDRRGREARFFVGLLAQGSQCELASRLHRVVGSDWLVVYSRNLCFA